MFKLLWLQKFGGTIDVDAIFDDVVVVDVAGTTVAIDVNEPTSGKEFKGGWELKGCPRLKDSVGSSFLNDAKFIVPPFWKAFPDRTLKY